MKALENGILHGRGSKGERSQALGNACEFWGLDLLGGSRG